MGAIIIPSRGIAVSGTTVENEPIIKSDGVGEVMQWKPSDDGADGVFITETSGALGLQLGVGVTPVATTFPSVQIGSDCDQNDTPNIIISDDTSKRGEIGYSQANDTEMYLANIRNHDSARMDFRMKGNTTAHDVLSLLGDGTATFAGTVTIGSLDIGHGAGGATCTAVGTDALDNSHASATHNTAVGHDALTGIHTDAADYNTAVGSVAGAAITSGTQNTAIGAYALDETDDGGYNVAVGVHALGANCATNNTAVGFNALNDFTGSNATAVGSGAASGLTVGLSNTAIGYNTLVNSQENDFNTVVGHLAGWATNNLSDSNTYVGDRTAYFKASGSNNVAIGRYALDGNVVSISVAVVEDSTTATPASVPDATIAVGQTVTGSGISVGTYVSAIAGGAGTVTSFTLSQAATAGATITMQVHTNIGSFNIAIGSYALDATTTGFSNVAIGHSAGSAITVGTQNVSIGHEAGDVMTNNLGNVAIGPAALGNAASGENYNVAIGGYALGAENSAAKACVAIGWQALRVQNTVDSNNVAVGYRAAYQLNGGTDSVYVGYNAGGDGAISGNDNVVIGKAAGYDLTSGYSNVLIGRSAGLNLTQGIDNIAIGHGALDAANTAGGGSDGGSENYNIAIGSGAMGAETTGAEYCVAIGTSALILQDADVKNTVIGGLAGDAIVGGSSNTLVGYSAGSTINAGYKNTVLGHNAYVLGTANNNTVIGFNAGASVVDGTPTAGMSGDSNVLVGSYAGYGLTDGPGNVLVGKNAGKAMTTGDYNIAIGYQAADGLAGAANNNIAIGKDALGGCTAATSSNIAIGSNALTNASYAAANINVAIGFSAGLAITSGTQNVLIGHEAGSTIATQDASTAVGYNALKDAVGSENVAIGKDALKLLDDGQYNTAVGTVAMATAAGHEDGNTAIGYAALFALTDDAADGNVAVGKDAGRYYDTTPDSSGQEEDDTGEGAMTKARYCIYIGHAAKGSHATTASNEVVIGNNGVGHGSHSVTLGNVATSNLVCADSSLASTSDSRIKRDINENAIGLDFIEKLATVNYKRLNPASWPVEIKESRWRNRKNKEIVTPAVKAADEVWEDAIVQDAREATEEETRDEVHAAVAEVRELQVTQEAREEVTEERVVQEAQEKIVGERHKHSEREVSEDVTTVEFVKNDDGDYVRTETTKTETTTERTPLYTDHDVVNPDGTPCVDASGEPVTYQCPVMEEYVVQEACDEKCETVVIESAQEEVKEEVVVVEAADEWTESHVTRPAEEAREEITERRLVSAAVEAKEAVYETVTVPADDRPDDDDTVRLGLIAQDVQTAMTEAGVEFDLVNESPNGKLSLKYGNLVMPLIKAVQELSARVKTLEA